MVYVSSRAKHIIKRYYSACGLEDLILKLINELPTYLYMKLGKDVDFWEKEMDNPRSKIHSLNLLDGAIEFATKTAENLSEKHNKSICEYLADSIERNWPGNYLAGYIRKMLWQYYKL